MAEKEQIETLEKGNIYFFYRPKVDVADEISKAEDVQDFYFVLGPESGKRYRIINMGRDRMPGKNRKERTWGFVTRTHSDRGEQTGRQGVGNRPAERGIGRGGGSDEGSRAGQGRAPRKTVVRGGVEIRVRTPMKSNRDTLEFLNYIANPLLSKGFYI